MIQEEKELFYLQAVKELKSAILKSRLTAATLVNKELLVLYFFIGKYVSHNTRSKNWGTSVIDNISNHLQQELNGLRGFSATNIKNMRTFYEEWKFLESLFIESTSITYFDSESNFRQIASDDFNETEQIKIEELKSYFFQVGFSNHIAIINKIKTIELRLFYIEKSAKGFWTFETLRHHLKQELHKSIGLLVNNFDKTLVQNNFKNKALLSFKNEIFLDFINFEDADDEPDEKIFEQEIVQNIKKFILAFGAEFCFIGNQFRLVIEEEEFYIDLLFFNRKLQSLVAIELKKGKFKAEYVGKMNLYLSGLDEYVKQPHENPSIGIILCKEKNNKIVEFAFRDTSKPMGVITYKTQNDLPAKYKNSLPNLEDLKKLL